MQSAGTKMQKFIQFDSLFNHVTTNNTTKSNATFYWANTHTNGKRERYMITLYVVVVVFFVHLSPPCEQR